MQNCLEIKLATAFLEKILHTFSQQVHYHNMIHLAIFSLFISNKVQKWDKCLSSELMNQLAFPEQHNVALHLDCFLLNN